MALILHLEDEESLCEILRFSLSVAEPQPDLMQFMDSDSAIKYIDQHLSGIDLYLLDIRVPGSVDGIGVAEHIRKLGSTKPIIISSAFRKPESHLLERLNCKWMQKPWHVLDTHRTILPLLEA